MAKAVFRPGEIARSDAKIILDAPFKEELKTEEAQEDNLNLDDIFEGPTADQLRVEAEEFKRQWEAEKTAMVNAAKVEADLIVNDARMRADEKIKASESEIAEKIDSAQALADDIKKDAEAAQTAAVEAARVQAGEIKESAQKEGFEKGRAEGYDAGKIEVQRLVVRTQLILSKIQDKRNEIFTEAEQQIVNLTLLIARKIVKTIGETQKTTVLENIREALGKVKTRGNVIVKVNLADLELSTARLQEFTTMIEAGGNIQIHEDSSVDPGGCVISTDFGEIDARIASQFAELESKIVSVSPITSR